MESNLEIWKKTRFSDNYEVSSLGRVRSLERLVKCGPNGGFRKKRQQILSPFVVKNTGYVQVMLDDRKKHSVHRLVAFEFCDGYFDGAVVNHKNGVRTDNRACNLEWLTSGENIIHGYKFLGAVGPFSGKFGKDHNVSKPIKMTWMHDGKSEYFYSGMDAIRKYPELDSASISKCCNGKYKSHAGRKFEFFDVVELY